MPIDVSPENHKTTVQESKKPVILDVYASWCGPCKMFEPIFAEVAELHGDTYTFAKLNAEENADLAAHYGVTALPTILFIKDGEVVAKEQGYMDKDQFVERITTHFEQ